MNICDRTSELIGYLVSQQRERDAHHADTRTNFKYWPTVDVFLAILR